MTNNIGKVFLKYFFLECAILGTVLLWVAIGIGLLECAILGTVLLWVAIGIGLWAPIEWHTPAVWIGVIGVGLVAIGLFPVLTP